MPLAASTQRVADALSELVSSEHRLRTVIERELWRAGGALWAAEVKHQPAIRQQPSTYLPHLQASLYLSRAHTPAHTLPQQTSYLSQAHTPAHTQPQLQLQEPSSFRTQHQHSLYSSQAQAQVLAEHHVQAPTHTLTEYHMQTPLQPHTPQLQPHTLTEHGMQTPAHALTHELPQLQPHMLMHAQPQQQLQQVPSGTGRTDDSPPQLKPQQQVPSGTGEPDDSPPPTALAPKGAFLSPFAHHSSQAALSSLLQQQEAEEAAEEEEAERARVRGGGAGGSPRHSGGALAGSNRQVEAATAYGGGGGAGAGDPCIASLQVDVLAAVGLLSLHLQSHQVAHNTWLLLPEDGVKGGGEGVVDAGERGIGSR